MSLLTLFIISNQKNVIFKTCQENSHYETASLPYHIFNVSLCITCMEE